MYLEDLRYIANFILAAIFAAAVLMACIALGMNHLKFPAQAAAIEQLRSDMEELGTAATSEDVLGQATFWNQRIAMWKRYNAMPIIGWVIPDSWDEINPIKLPRP